MAAKKSDHVIMRNNKIFCSHCGSEQVVSFPIEIPVFIAMGNAFSKNHQNCVKKWEQPKVDETLSESTKADFWLSHGERGTSSEFMFQTISGRHIGAHYSHPRDPSDFNRCHGLLEMVPEWREQLNLMAATSATWKNLVDNWDKLTQMLNEQMKVKKANGMYMYEFMETLGC